MRKVKFLDALCVLNFVLLILICLSFTSIEDTLLFKTDLVNLIHFFTGVNLLFLLVFLAPFILFFVTRKENTKGIIVYYLSLFALANILFGFIYNIVMRPLLNFKSLIWIFTIVGLLYISCFLISFFLTDKDEITSRIIKTSKFLTLFVFLFFISLTSFRHINKNLLHSPLKRTNVVVIIMDGLSTNALPYYNPKISIPEFDEISQSSMVYMNHYTNFTYTYGYFSALFSGCKDRSNFSRNVGRKTKMNLFSLLQEEGVNTRWSVHHPNAMPDASKNSSYKGLRSLYLNENLSWFPYLLGMDYNVYRFTGKRKKERLIHKKIQRLIISLSKKDTHPFETYLVDEIKRLRNYKRPYFLIYHTTASGEVNPKDRSTTDTELWEDLKVKSKIDRINKKIRKNDYVYEEKYSWLINKWYDKYTKGVRRGIESLNRFFKIFREKGWNKDTILIVTADHGKIFSKGKVWYGYHNEEEVAKVPLIIFDNQNVGFDDRLGETIDITQTILDFFNTKERLSDKAISLVVDERRKNIVTTLTTRSGKRKEHFLNVYQYKNGRIYKYIFNLLNKNGPYEAILKNFDTIMINQGKPVLNNLKFNYNEILSEYSLN